MNTSLKKIIVTLGIVCLGFVSFGQTITIGYGTTLANTMPYNNYYKYAVSQSIYMASEIGKAGHICSIAYNVAASSVFANQSVKVYMKHTTQSSFASTSNALTFTASDLVYDGVLTLGSSTGWEKIKLQKVFEYNGADNLVIAVARKIPSGGTFNSSLKYYYSTGSSLYCRADNDETCGDISHSMAYTLSQRANIQIEFAPEFVDGYYQISDAKDLLWFADYVNSGHTTINGKLTTNIDLTGIDWVPIGYSSNGYAGTFDGNGDTISNVTFNDNTQSYVGLFGYVSSGTIKNLGVDKSSFTGKNNVGGIVGYLNGGTVAQCCNKGIVEGTTYVGGIVGCNSGGRIENAYITGADGVSYSTAVVKASTSYAGGICGYNTGTITSTYIASPHSLKVLAGTSAAGGIAGYNSGTLINCFTLDFYISSPKYCGSIVGMNSGGTFTGCMYYIYSAHDGSSYQNGCGSATTGSTTANPTGITSEYSFDINASVGFFCYLLNGSISAGSPWRQTIGEDSYPVLDETHLPIYKIGTAYSNESITFPGGSGAPYSLFQIPDAETLKKFAYLVNIGNQSICGQLTADIVLNEQVLDEKGNLRSDYKTANLEQWTPIASFKGSFYGNNHTISGLYINKSSTNVGLFASVIDRGLVSGVGIVDSYVHGNGYVGALSGQTASTTRITSCYNKGVVEGDSYYVGGVIGMAGGTITDCYNTGNVSSKEGGVGGIAGCYGYYMGNATVTGCYNTGNVICASSDAVGGIAGTTVNNTISFSKCYNTGTIIGKTNVGGCFGKITSSSHSATNCYNTGSVVAVGGNAGGVVANNAGSVSYCFNGGSVAGSGSVGGVAGSNTGTISYCYYNSDFCSFGGINSVNVAESAEALTSSTFVSGTLPSNFDSNVWTAGNMQNASSSIETEDNIMGYRVIGVYPSLTNVGSAQNVVVNYVNVGTETKPEWITNFIPIYTITDFKNIQNNLSATYVLMNDIVETENFTSLNVFTPTVTWPTIGPSGDPFTGKIYGNNHTISGVFVNSNSFRAGLINTASGAVIRDLGLVESKIQGEFVGVYAGGICGYVENNTTIFNCYNDAEVRGTVAGGITSKGYNATITQCRNYGTIMSMASENASGVIGGIIGELYFTTVQLCYNEGTITSDLKAGGIAGEGGYTSLRNTYNAGTVIGQQAGGILGNGGSVGGRYNCLNVGRISGSVNAGGILGGGSSGSSSGAATENTCCYYDINTSNVEGGVNGADAHNLAEGRETDDLCLELQAGLPANVWGIKEPIIVGNKKYLYYPYLNCFGEESARIGTYRPISKVTLNPNGGTCTALTQYIEREGATLPTDVTRAGHTFEGWYTNASCTSERAYNIPVTATGEQTFYAKWAPVTYSITLNANGGTINSGVVSSYTYGVGATLPIDITKTGYTFGGWYTNSSYSGTSVQSVSITATGNKTYYAKWTPNQYSITYVTNNGTINAGNVTQYTYETGATLPTNVTKTGYTFAGWYTNDSYSGASVLSVLTTDYGDKTFYAKWNVESYDITLNVEGGTINSGNITSYIYGVGATLPIDISKTGYSFDGWYDNQSYSGSSVLSVPSNVTGDKVFYAKWEPISYSITYNVNEGTIMGTPQTAYYYGNVVTLPTPTRNGYTFGGWYNNSNLTGMEVTEISSLDYGDKVFYAKWTANEYQVSLITDGGTIIYGDVTNYTYGTYTSLPLNITRTGYTFEGWYPVQSCDVVLEPCQRTTSLLSKLRTLLGCSLAEARDTIDHAPSTLFKNISFENAIIYKEQLEAVGAKISFESYVLSNGSSFCDLYLESYGSQKIAVIKAVKNYTGLGLGESKALVEAAPVTILSHVEYATAQALKAELDAIGSDVLSSYANELGASASTAIYPTDFGDKYFGAKWDTINYTITYNANEGVFATTPAESYKYGDEVTLPTPTRVGYTFAGWYNNSNLVGTEFIQVESTETGNKEFWAKWDVNTYTVSLDAKGGDINSGNVASYTYNVLTILPQDVTKVGHTFEGWFDSENQKVTQISKGTVGNVTFTAKWTAKTYSVTLQANNGTINSGNVTSYTFGTAVTLPTKEQIIKTGYEFLGWYDNSSYDGGAVTEIADNEIGNKNFWARWTAASYEVTLDAAGGTINSNVIERYTYGVGAVLPTDVTKIGFEFKGWKDEENADALEITTADYGDKTFTAQWEQANYGITYDAKGGSINEEYVSTYNYNVGEITLPTDVTKEGNEFGGWYDNPNFTGERVTVIPQTSYGAKTFYANWVAQKYDVTFVSNGGTINSGAFDKYTYGEVASLPTNVTKDGYTFTGWYTDEACEGDVASIISSTSTGVKTFYAGWSNTAYAVTLYTNDGIISSGNVTAYTFGTEVQLPTKEQISKTGYTFGGWYDNASCTGDSVLSVSSTATGDKQFWAKWKVESYLITFETDGGTVNSGNVKNYIYGTTVVLPSDVTKTGYTFEGWYDNESCSGSSVLSVSSNDLGDKTFYAKWLVNSYDITFVTNEGTINAGELNSYTYGVGATLPTDVTKTGYTFDGWFTNTSYIGSSVSSVLPTETGNKTFYAKWSVKSYAVTLNANGGTITNGEIDSYTYGVGATLPIAKNVVKTGYTFNGWYDNDEFAGEAVTAIVNNAVGEKTFYAKWTINTYDVTLNANGGTINAGEISKYEFGTGATLPNAVTKEGYTFVGWYDNANLTGEAFTAIANNVTGDKTFYARYTVNTYTVNLVTNGGTINNGNVTNYTYGVGATLPADVTKTGYAFKGWYDNENFDGDAITTIANNEVGDKTYYAKFTVNTYNVILVTNEGVINSDNVESYEFGKGATLPTDVTKEGYSFGGWYSNSSYIGGPVSSIAGNDMGDKQFWAKWTINEYEVTATAENGNVEGTGSYEYKSTATLKAVPNDGYEFVGWNDNTLTDARIQFVVTKDTTLVANFKEKEKVQIVGSLEIPTLKTERESAPIDLAGLFTTTEGGEVTYSATSSAPNVVAATVSEGKLFLTVYEYEGEAEITVTATLPNGEKNYVKATANVVLACNIQVEETITNVSCFGESDGEIALKVTNAAEPYTTKWENETSVEDTIRNIVAGNYSVVITDNENCVYNKTYTVTEPAEMTLKATVKNPTCENADGSISIVLTGAENATFAWSNEATTQNVASLEKGDYSVVITNTETGCQISDSYTLVEPEAPVISVATTVETACDKADGAVYISTNSDDLRYMWSNSKTTKDLENVRAGDYTLDVVDSKNCKASLNVTVPSIQLKQPEIALVTVSQESGKNLVVWLKENTDLIDYYTIYRVDTAKNKYDKVADVPYGELSVYEDLAANPMERAWKYKMSATDVCGNETAMSDYHSSLHLMKIKSLGVENHLAWDPYEGIDFDSYVILRKTKVKGVVEIDTLATIPSDLTSYTDTLPARGTTSYYVGVKLPETINPKTQFLKAESGPFAIALSNIAELETFDVPVRNVVKSNIEVYAIGHTIYVKNSEGKTVTLFDNSGRVLERREIDMPIEEFMVRLDGVYFVRVDGESFAVIVK